MTTFPPAVWRLLSHPSSDGAWNMAVDEAILEAVMQGSAPPTLRQYAWEPACLSLGYAQPIADVDMGRLSAHGWQVVRRPTGGRAILHTDELTYSVIGPSDEPRLAGDILGSYRVLSGALLAALNSLSLPASSQPNADAPAGSPAAPICFEVPSNYEITVEGKKLIGSAQARRKDGVLQHGTLPLVGDLARITQALVFPDETDRTEAAERLLAHATTVESVLGRPVSWQEAADAFTAGFSEALNLTLEAEDLTPKETARAEALAEEKHRSPEWLHRK